MDKIKKFKFALLGIVVVALCGAGVAFAVSSQDSGSDVPVDPSIQINVDENLSAAALEQISHFSTLNEPTDENIAALPVTDQQWIRYGLSHVEGAKPATVSSVGLERTELGNDVLVFTSADQICVYATRDQELLNGTCSALDKATSGGVYVTGEYRGGPDFYVVGVVPDDVQTVAASPKSAGTINLTGNVYEGVVAPENIVIEGMSDAGDAITKTSVPLKMFAGG
ncbi:MAG: hypothetical protein J0H98_00115 [Solirubrobacterales bacterium]|nr:hypothetical protein [Solirubrobacterales bacterium]